MLKYIVAPAPGLPSDERVLAAALSVARAFDAHVEFVHVRVDVAKLVMTAGVAGLVEPQSQIDAMDATEADAQSRARATVARLCAAAGVALEPPPGGSGASAAFSAETGNEADWVSEYGRFADLIVVGRVDDGTSVTIDVAESALLDSGTPILLAPARERSFVGGHVVVAWTDTRSSLRAVHAAMPFIERAREVTIVCLNADAAAMDAARRLHRAMLWHNPRAALVDEQCDAEQVVATLFGVASRLDAQLLVMGGYSHSPLREMIFGGATKSVLSEAVLPVLMAH